MRETLGCVCVKGANDFTAAKSNRRERERKKVITHEEGRFSSFGWKKWKKIFLFSPFPPTFKVKCFPEMRVGNEIYYFLQTTQRIISFDSRRKKRISRKSKFSKKFLRAVWLDDDVRVKKNQWNQNNGRASGDNRGLVVRILAFYSYDQCLNPAEA